MTDMGPSLGQVAFEAFVGSPGVSWNTWEGLSEHQRWAWQAAAARVVTIADIPNAEPYADLMDHIAGLALVSEKIDEVLRTVDADRNGVLYNALENIANMVDGMQKELETAARAL